MNTNQREWLRLALPLFNSLRKPSCLLYILSVCALFNGTAAYAEECTKLHVINEGSPSSSFDFISQYRTVQCIDETQNDKVVASVTFKYYSLYSKDSIEHIYTPSERHSYYTFVNTASTTEPKQTFKIRMSSSGWEAHTGVFESDNAPQDIVVDGNRFKKRGEPIRLFIKDKLHNYAADYDFQLANNTLNNDNFGILGNELRATNAEPGHYKVHVIASNQWHEISKTIDIEVVEESKATPRLLVNNVVSIHYNPADNFHHQPKLNVSDLSSYRFSIKNNPSWISLIEKSGLLTVFSKKEVGLYSNIELSAHSDTKTIVFPPFEVSVINPIRSPKPSIYKDFELIVDKKSEFKFYFPSEDNQNIGNIKLSITGMPDWLSVKNNKVVGTPPLNTLGKSFTGKVHIKSLDAEYTTIGEFTVKVIAEPPPPPNKAPSISGEPTTQIDEWTSYSFTPVAQDPDTPESLVFSIENQPRWTHFNTNTGELSGFASGGNIGTYSNIIISVSDGTYSASLPAFSITVIGHEDPPTAGPQRIFVNEDESIYFKLNADDPDGPYGLAITLVNPPKHGTVTFTDNIERDQNLYIGQPNYFGEDSFTYRITDPTGFTAEAEVKVTVRPVQDAPTVTVLSSLATKEDEFFTYTPEADDVDNDELTFSIDNKPDWLKINTATGTIYGRPRQGDVDTYTSLRYGVWDGKEMVSSEEFTLTVINVNDAPLIYGSPPTSVKEDYKFTYKPQVLDVDPNDAHSFIIKNQPNWIEFDPKTGRVSGTPTDRDVGIYKFFVFAKDIAGAISEPLEFNLEVININDTPMLYGSPIRDINEDSGYNFKPTLRDPDKNDTHTFSIENKPEWAWFNTKTGTLTGTPSNEHVGVYSDIRIAVTDSAGAMAYLPTFSIEVYNTNDLPELSGQPAHEIAEDSPYVFTPTLHDVDQGDTHTFSIENKPNWATFDVTTGTLSGTPLDEHVGKTEEVTISVKDSVQGSSKVSLPAFSIEVTNTNDAPTASGADFTLAEGELLTVSAEQGLLTGANDDDLDSGDNIVTILLDKMDFVGELILNVDGSFSYQHDGSESFKSTFRFVVRDTHGALSEVQMVNLTITPVEDAPVAQDDEATTQEDTAVKINLVDNDSDAENNLVAASVQIEQQPEHGSVSLENGVATYTPSQDFNGDDSFSYTVKDAEELVSNIARVNLAISAVNDAPNAENINLSIEEDTPVSHVAIRAIAKDIEDEGGKPLGSIKLIDEAKFGTLTLNQDNGTFDYAPNLNVSGVNESIKYVIHDNDGLTSLEKTITINIGAINDRPVAESDIITTDEDVATELAVLANDSDIEDTSFNGANITLEDQGQGAGVYAFATVTVQADGKLNIVPTKDVFGEFTFTYTLTDSEELASKPATVKLTINSVNDAPIAKDDIAQVDEDGSFEINVLGNDTDVDIDDAQKLDKLDTSSVALANQPENGSAEVLETGAIVYKPAQNFSGEDSFTYTVEDSHDAISNVATVIVTIIPINDAPEATPAHVSVNEDNNVTVTLTATDDETSEISYHISLPPSYGSLEQVDKTTWIYAPNNNYHGSDYFEFIANDGEFSSEPAQIEIDIVPVNDAPTVSEIEVDTNEETEISFALLGSDIDSQTLTYSIVGSVSNGSVIVESNTVLYTPNVDFVGTESLSYIASDGSEDSNPATIKIHVKNTNDAPSLSGVPHTYVAENQEYRFTPTLNDVDDNDTHSFSINNKPVWATFDTSTGTLSGIPKNEHVGKSKPIIISVKDNAGAVTSLDAFTIEVNNVNDRPVLAGNPLSTIAQDDTYQFVPTLIDVDKGDSHTFSIQNQPEWTKFDTKTGELSGTPHNEHVKTYQDITISVTDTAGAKASLDAFDLTVNNVNDAPTISGQPANTVSEDTAYSFKPTFSDPDLDIPNSTESVTFSIVNKPSWADFDTATGQLSGTPKNEHVGKTEQIVISVNDKAGASASLTAFTLEVTNVNDTPVAYGFDFSVKEAATLAITSKEGLLSTAHDDDKDDELKVELVSNPAHGALTLNADGSFNYTHDGSETLNDEFKFVVKDKVGAASEVQTVNLTIIPVEDAPIAQDDEASTQEDTVVKINLVDNDSDAENNLVVASVQIEQQPAHGSVSLENGVATYTPSQDFNGEDSFSYTVKDAEELVSNIARVNLAISAVNDAPNAENINLSIEEDTPVSDVAIRDIAKDIEDEGGKPLGSIKLIDEAKFGTLILNQDAGTFDYTPNLNVSGVNESIKYVIHDNDGLTSLEKTITINIGAVNDRPVAENDIITTDEDVTTELTVLANDSDIEDTSFNGANISLEDQGQGAGVYAFATVTVLADGKLNIAPAKDIFGEFTFTYTLTDSEELASQPATVTLTINSVNDAPIANDNEVQVDEDGSFEINVLGNDTDVDIDEEKKLDSLNAASVTVVTQPENGSVEVLESGAIVYKPALNFSGEDSFTYTVEDAHGAISNKAKVLITINAVNDAPIANSTNISVVEDGQSIVTLTGSDIEKSPLTFSITTTPSKGTLTKATDITWLYKPNANFNGTDSFAFTANDGKLNSQPALVDIKVTPVNDAPKAQALSTSTAEEESVTIVLKGEDIDGQSLSFELVSDVNNGTVTLANDSVTYTPSNDFFGTDTFTYVANDGALNSAPATVSITVENINDAPEISGTPVTSIKADGQYSFTPTVTDVDSSTFTFSIVNKPSWASFDTATGALSGNPARADVGVTNNIEISVSDAELSASLAPFNIAVAFTNTPPRTQPQTINVDEDGTTTFVPQADDVDGDKLALSIVQQPQSGTVIIQGNVISYTPDANYHGTDTFSYFADDGSAKSAETQISVTVKSINDVPKAQNDSFELTVNESNRYSLDVLVNDNDADQQPLTIVGAQASIGSVTIENGQLVYQAANSASANVTVSYVISDPEQARSNAVATISLVSNLADAPQIVAPDDITVNASGLFTKVDLGIASATDAQGNTLAVSLTNGKRVFKPGKHLVYWQTEDAQGRQAIATQNVTIQPQVSIDRGMTVSEGGSYTLAVALNGDAPSYPVSVPYTVSGTASELDHNLQSGEVEITQGRTGVISFEVYQDSQLQEPDETLIVTLNASLNTAPAASEAKVTIAQGNVAPEVTTSVTQQGEQRTLVAKDQGEIVLQAIAKDVNAEDTLTVEWQSAQTQVVNTSNSPDTFAFSPTELAAGLYQFTVKVSDNGEPALSASKEVYIEVIEQLASLTSQDSDGDLIPDNEEGYSDSDSDGIPDYLDAIGQPNVLQSMASNSGGFLIEAQPGTQLRKGVAVANNNSGGAQLLASELPQDDSAQNVGGLYDFVASGLMNAGDVFTIVLPQSEPIPVNAIYRKYQNGQWVNFNVGNGDDVMSAPGSSGYCPSLDSTQWKSGLHAGNWCIKLHIVDGGPNDDDGKANKQVVDPSGMAVVLNGNQLPVANADAYKVIAGKRTLLELLSNDTDPDNNALTLHSASSELGLIELAGDAVYFTSPDNFAGDIELNYLLVDSQGGSANGVAVITTFVNTAPVAIADKATTKDTQSIVIDVLANDSDKDGDALNITQASVDTGTVDIVDNALHYSPKAGFSGIALIHYTIADIQGAEASANVEVTVAIDSVSITKPSESSEKNSSSGSFGALILFVMLGAVTRRRTMRFM